jgi:hypothetical protein
MIRVCAHTHTHTHTHTHRLLVRRTNTWYVLATGGIVDICEVRDDLMNEGRGLCGCVVCLRVLIPSTERLRDLM